MLILLFPCHPLECYIRRGARGRILRGVCRHLGLVFLLLVFVAGVARAQQASPEDEAINAMRRRADIGPNDQGRIARWVGLQVGNFAGFSAFRDRLTRQYDHAGNSAQFRLQLAAQTAQVAAQHFASPNLEGELAYSLAYVLAGMNRLETLPGLLAGLESSDARARYMCAKGLVGNKRSIAAEKTNLDKTVQALRAAGLVETDGVVLGRIYEALAYPGQTATVLDSYLDLFDKRLGHRRTATVIVDGAEWHAYEFFRAPGALSALNGQQKAQLAARLAVFLRMDAQRYNTAERGFDEIDKIERLLDGAEAVLSDSQMVGPGKGGNMRDALSAGGHGNRQALLQEAYRWVGDPKSNTPGALSEAPWSVPVGAP